MRVGIVAEQLRQPIPGGIGTYADGLLGGLLALEEPDLEVVALTSRAPTVDPVARGGMRVAATPWPHRVQMALWDAGLSRPSGLDVLHRTSLAGPAATAATASTVMVHDLGWRRHPELTTSRGRRWHEAALGRTLRSRAELVVPAPAIAMDLERAGVAPDRIHVIGEGADHLPAPDLEAAARLRHGLGISGDFVLTVSTLEPRKNLRSLVAAHAAAAERAAVPPLLIVGPSGWGDSGVEAADGVRLAGPVSGAVLAGLYATCTLFVYVPLHEGFGLPPLEAMAQGAPVVASTAVPSMEGAPVLASVDARSVPSIAAAIEESLADHAARRAAAQAGPVHAAGMRWVDVAAAHLELWRSLS